MEPVLIKTQAEVEVMIVTIIQDKEEAGKTQKTVRVHEALLCLYRKGVEDRRGLGGKSSRMPVLCRGHSPGRI